MKEPSPATLRSLTLAPIPFGVRITQCIMNYLLKTFNRYDVLKYNEEKSIRVASWDYIKREIDIRTLLPPGKFLAK